MPSDLEIARAAALKPIAEIAEKAGIPVEALIPHGKHIAKVDLDFVKSLEGRKDGKLILVTAISPTPAGEGKTTTTVGLGDGLNRISKRAMIALREPSLGPCFGTKGGAAGGGYSQIVPMETINLHFTGDFHAITSAHNLLSAMLDNHIYWGNALDIDTRRITWRRALDMNDRSLRAINSSLGGVSNGFPREDGFDITVASEVMAVFCLARDHAELEARLGKMVIGYTRAKNPVRASDLKAHGAMTVLLRDALLPNLVQSLEGSPAFVHGGPFANIAHGCNSVIATRTALKLSDYVVTEAGFGADLGAEKFFNIKCRKAGLSPDAAVVVATIRALKMHGGVDKGALAKENLGALQSGLANLDRHVSNLRKFGVKAIVAINRFDSDTAAEHALVAEHCRSVLGIDAVLCSHWADGSKGIEELARKVALLCGQPATREAPGYRPLYPDSMPLMEKLRLVAREIYGAADISADLKVQGQFKQFEEAGFSHFPICVAKTQFSFSADPALRGAPTGHVVPVRELRLSAGAEFIVAICGDIMTMPGLPRKPAAEEIRLDSSGKIQNLS